MNRITFVTLCFWQVVLKGSCLSNPVPECRCVKVHVILYGYQSPALSPVFFLSFRLALYTPNASSVAENLSEIHEKLYSECLDICKNYENPLISFSNLEKNGKYFFFLRNLEFCASFPTGRVKIDPTWFITLIDSDVQISLFLWVSLGHSITVGFAKLIFTSLIQMSALNL